MTIMLVTGLALMAFAGCSKASENVSYDACINQTGSEPECKDCCDCIDGDANARKECRDACRSQSFSGAGTLNFRAPSTLGRGGDYSACVETGTEQACKKCCDDSNDLACGDFRFCRDACNEAFGGSPGGGQQQPRNNQLGPGAQGPPPPRDGSQQAQGGFDPGRYSIEQAISDHAQETTIAFAALAFMTGDLCSDTFIPPGKVSDYFGFQYLRDTDTGELGHNTSFVPRSANNVLYILNDSQKADLIKLATEQVKKIGEFGYTRFPLMDAFRRQLEGDIPAGSTGLDRQAVMGYAADLYELDGVLSTQRARVLGAIIRSLDADQRAYLDKMATGNSLSWPEMPDQVDKRAMSHEQHVAVMTYASEMFSWYAGDVESDTYFCPERHGTYFGAFYMKDMPAMGNPGYSISTSITGDSGQAFLAILTPAQRELISSLVHIQRSDMLEIVETRRKISAQLRRFMESGAADEQAILDLSARYGELDGEISYYYATHFAKVYETLTDQQKAQLTQLRNLADYPCSGAYLYSQNVSMPNFGSTDFLFGTD